jgi:membrane associated rhomboid family serine protease
MNFLVEASQELENLMDGFYQNFPLVLKVIIVLWAINIIDWTLKGYLSRRLGLVPRNIFGVPGILCSVLFHGDFWHLVFNTIPLSILSVFILNFGINIYFEISLIIILLEGILVWILGRNGNHIGASGLVSGYFGFILFFSYFSPSVTSWFLAIVAFYYFGSILLGLFPTQDKISWESHLFGFLSGGVAAYGFYFNYF